VTRAPVIDVAEAAFQATVIEAARMFRWRVAHFRPAMTTHGWRTAVQADGKGFPDLVLVRGDRLIFAELKRDGAKPSPDQREWLEALDPTPAEVYVWRPRDLQAIADALK
jgi:hypothetical protein